MDETVLLPSPNWFQVSGVAVTKDSWLVYGGPSKSLCVLEPLPDEFDPVVQSPSGFKAHTVAKAHPEKIISVDISPEWPEKRYFVTGSADGSVKQWLAEYDSNKQLQVKTTHSHDVHKHDKEELAGLGYSNETYVVTVGVFGNIVKWDVNSNVVKNYSHFLKSFRPTCISCSRHTLLHVAVGTKQGVVFLIDLNAPGQILYKIRAHDEDITNLSWCPQYEIGVRKSLNSALNERLDKIRNEPEPEENELPTFNKSLVNDTSQNDSKNLSKAEIVEEDDLFDVYKDHEADEFGHKKFVPEDILVRVKSEEKQEDFLAECQRLKDEIIKRKNEPEPTIESLVEALDKTHVDNKSEKDVDNKSEKENGKENGSSVENEPTSLHIQRHMLATVGKHGGVKIWSKSGKLVSSCTVANNKHPKNKTVGWTTVLWYKPDVLLVADGKSQLLEINPLKIDCKNKLTYKVVHSLNKRGLYCIASAAPRVYNTTGEYSVWTVGQDRQLIEYSLTERRVVRNYMTCGGFVYDVAPCPYDANKVAIAVGDGSVRVWEADQSGDGSLRAGAVASYWQNVQGKVLQVAWHPTKENLLAFSTAEARVGLIDTRGGSERAARLLPQSAGGVYSLSWAPEHLYAAGGGRLTLYPLDGEPKQIPVTVDGVVWKISSVRCNERGVVVGSQEGAVAVLEASHAVVAAVFPFTKIIHSMDWHPQQVSESAAESPNKNLIAVSSLDKSNDVVILEFSEKQGEKKLEVWKTLSGHKGPVHTVAWNPNKEGELLTTSQDGTVRVWNVQSATCQSIFGNHGQSCLGAAWAPWGEAAVVSGGADCCLRLWRTGGHAAEAYIEPKPQAAAKKEKKKKEKPAKEQNKESDSEDEQVAAKMDTKLKVSKKLLLPITHKRMLSNSVLSCKKLLKKYVEKNGGESIEVGEDPASDYSRLFGSINEVNELLDEELCRHGDHSSSEAYALLSVLRGRIDQLFQFASQKDLICPFLLSLAPCVSFKYWKDATQMYLAQIDRLVAKGEYKKLEEGRSFGGPIFRKMALLLSAHDVRGAVQLLTDSLLFKEAYALCRVRHMDSIAEEVLLCWAKHSDAAHASALAAACYIALGDIQQASFVLGKSNDEEHLGLAAELAKISGQKTFAGHIEAKTELIKSNKKMDEALQELPTRMELLMKNQVKQE